MKIVNYIKYIPFITYVTWLDAIFMFVEILKILYIKINYLEKMETSPYMSYFRLTNEIRQFFPQYQRHMAYICLFFPQVPVTNYLYSPIPLYILYNSKGIQHPFCTAVR